MPKLDSENPIKSSNPSCVLTSCFTFSFLTIFLPAPASAAIKISPDLHNVSDAHQA